MMVVASRRPIAKDAVRTARAIPRIIKPAFRRCARPSSLDMNRSTHQNPNNRPKEAMNPTSTNSWTNVPFDAAEWTPDCIAA